MKLDEFIETTLKNISSGIEGARSSMDGNIVIAPQHDSQGAARRHNFDYDIQDVDFDVAVTTTETTEGGAKASIKILAGKVSGNSEHINASRVKFTVTIGVRKQA